MNLYQILGVLPEAGEDTIKKAYRKAAKECHPDTHPGDKKAEARFKEIGEAYQILSDKQKRKKYDETILKNRKQKRNNMGTKVQPKINPMDVTDLFERYMGFKG